MIEGFFASQNLPFSVALVLMAFIGLVEGVATVLGAGISGFIDSVLPDFDVDIDVDIDADVDLDAAAGGGPELSSPGVLSSVLGWLHVGKVPFLVLLVVFLLSFGLTGLFVQSLVKSLVGQPLPAVLAVLPAGLVSLPVMRVVGAGIRLIIPKDETEAVSRRSFIGRVAVICVGTARQGSPTQAKLRDQHGRTQYVLVEPDVAEEQLSSGESVLLVSQQGAVFRAIRDVNPALVD